MLGECKSGKQLPIQLDLPNKTALSFDVIIEPLWHVNLEPQLNNLVKSMRKKEILETHSQVLISPDYGVKNSIEFQPGHPPVHQALQPSCPVPVSAPAATPDLRPWRAASRCRSGVWSLECPGCRRGWPNGGAERTRRALAVWCWGKKGANMEEMVGELLNH